MTEYGSDIAGVEDVDAELSFVDGPRGVAESLACRLGNVPGTTEDAPSDGYDLTLLIGSIADTAEVQRKVVQQMTADERVARARATVTQGAGTLTVTIQVTLVTGVTFSMVLDVSSARVALVEFNFQEAA